jgi:hypothetical protein
MSKMGNYVLGLEEDAALMTREEFIRTNGAANVDVWDRVNGSDFEPDVEVDDVGC